MDMTMANGDDRARLIGNMRLREVENYNIQAELLNRQIASDINQIKEDGANNLRREQESATQKEIQDGVTNALGIRGGLKDIFTGGSKELQKKAIEEATKSLGVESKEISGVASALQEGKSLEGALAGQMKKGLLAKAVESEALKGIGAKAGGLANIGLGFDALRKDYTGGQFKVAGNNWEERAGNELQIGAGIADAIGLAVPPVAAVGAVLGIAAGTIDALGERRESEEAVQQQKQQTKSNVQKLQAKERFTPKIAAGVQRAVVGAKVAA